MSIRLLFLADSHLGFDLPSHPRVKRRRRGHDFLANHIRALAPAMDGEVDLVVHGGDIFHRPRVPPSLVYQAFQPLVEVAESGIPVFVVPGNHERSRIPHHRFASTPNLHIFREPATFQIRVRDKRVALAGFPYHRKGIREGFGRILEETGWQDVEADIRLLCLHHCVEGATVGPSGYTFRKNPDVIRCSDLPEPFAAVLSGHIHRHQILRRDLQGRPLETPVFYPGSVERTAFAEMGEEKGFLILDLAPDGKGGRVEEDHFVPLPARPMLEVHLHPEGGSASLWSEGELEAQMEGTIDAAPKDAILRVRIQGQIPSSLRPLLAAPRLRHRSPPEMNLQLILVEDGSGARSGRGRRQGRPAPAGGFGHRTAPSPSPQLELPWQG